MRNQKIVNFNDKEELIEAIRNKKVKINNIEEIYKDDENVMFEFIKNDPLALEFASDRLKADKNFVKKVVKLYERAISYASKELREDPEMRDLAFRKGTFIIDLDAYREFIEIDKKIIFDTTPPRYFTSLTLENGLHTSQEEFSCFDLFLEVGENLIKQDLTNEQKRIIISYYLSRLKGRKIDKWDVDSKDISSVINLYKEYKQIEPIYSGKASADEISRIEKWLLQRKRSSHPYYSIKQRNSEIDKIEDLNV